MSPTVLANVTVIAVGGRGVLITGPSGAGKSSLALALIDRGAVLVGDDAVTLEARGEQAWASPPPNTAGLIEVRNVGLVTLPTDGAPIALVLTLNPDAPRYPLELASQVLCGCSVPVLPFRAGDATQALRAEYALEMHGLPFPVTPAFGNKAGQ